MHSDVEKLVQALKGQIFSRGYKQSDVAKRIGVTDSTFNKKLNMKENACFTLPEYVAAANSIGMSFKQLSDIAALQ